MPTCPAPTSVLPCYARESTAALSTVVPVQLCTKSHERTRFCSEARRSCEIRFAGVVGDVVGEPSPTASCPTQGPHKEQNPNCFKTPPRALFGSAKAAPTDTHQQRQHDAQDGSVDTRGVEQGYFAQSKRHKPKPAETYSYTPPLPQREIEVR